MGKAMQGAVDIAHMLGFNGNDNELAIKYLKCLRDKNILGPEGATIFAAIQHYDAIMDSNDGIPDEVNCAIEVINCRLSHATVQCNA